jgi:hypothetical protein
MITVHIHKFTAVFDTKPTDATDRDIALYMTMLLENTEMFQEFMDSQTSVDDTVISMGLEFDIPDPNAIQRSQSETDDKDDERNVWMIAGITVGCFLALLWMVFLHGLQNRPITDFTS